MGYNEITIHTCTHVVGPQL